MPGQVHRASDYVPAFAKVDTSTSGDNTIVAAEAGRKIKLLSYVLVADGAVFVRWKSGASTNLSGRLSLAANGGAVAPPANPDAGPWLETSAGEALVLNLSGAVEVGGHISYVVE